MKQLLTFLLCLFCGMAPAQRVSHIYNNVSMAVALRELNALQNKYIVNFIYDDLEDFKVTVRLHNETVPNAVRRIIGFYPVAMTCRDNAIMVECTHKARRHLTGKIIDEHAEPVPFANVLLLSPTDSTVIAGGVSNESGIFVVPFSQEKVIAKISYVGYETVYRLFTQEDAGTIRIKPSTFHLKTIKVKGHQQLYRLTRGGMTVDVEHSLLRQVGTAHDVLKLLPRVNVGAKGDISVFAKGRPEVYINNRLVRESDDLNMLKSTDIKSIDIITNPGARYNSAVQSVIRIRTKRPEGDGFSTSATASVSNNSQWNTRDLIDLKLRSGGWEFFGAARFASSFSGEDNTVSSTLHTKDHIIRTKQIADTDFRSSIVRSRLGFSYDFSTSHAVGISYSLFKSIRSRGICPDNTQLVWRDGQLDGSVKQNLVFDVFNGPDHEWNGYYVGKIGAVDVNLDVTYLWNKDGRNDFWQERSHKLADRDVHTYNLRHTSMEAAKLLLSVPMGKGTIESGVEMTHTKARSTYLNPENFVASTENDTRERNVAPFVSYTLPIGRWTFNAGLRYEHVATDYRTSAVEDAVPARNYNHFFPNLSVAWAKDGWSVELNMARKISRPSYRDLRSNVQYVNRFTYEAGNPYLRPVIISSVELNAVHRWASLSMGFSHRSHDIVYSSGLYDDKEVALIQNRNYPHTQSFYASVTLSPKFGWYQPELEVDFIKPFFNTFHYGSSRDLQDPSAIFSLNNKLVWSSEGFAMVRFSYNTEACTDFVKVRSSAALDLSLSLYFFHKALLLNVYANDVLKTRRSAWTLYGQQVVNTKDCYEFTRSIGLSLTYNFNASRSQYRGKGAGNAEKRRL